LFFRKSDPIFQKLNGKNDGQPYERIRHTLLFPPQKVVHIFVGDGPILDVSLFFWTRAGERDAVSESDAN
jgi:hypothetical protein